MPRCSISCWGYFLIRSLRTTLKAMVKCRFHPRKIVCCFVFLLVVLWFICGSIKHYGNAAYDDFVELEKFDEGVKNFSLVAQQSTRYSVPRHGTDHPCPTYPTNLLGNVTSDSMFLHQPWSRIRTQNRDISDGGWYATMECKARFKVAIIIPLRNRDSHLRVLLAHMHPIWKRQQIDYKVFVITQGGKSLFNRAKLLNIGVSEARKDGKHDGRNYDCFVFHDVDILVEDDRCLYWCDETNPIHISEYLSKFSYQTKSYRLLCHEYNPYAWPFQNLFRLPTPLVKAFGGISIMTETQIENVNGFSNLYWGWGGEDDDLYLRIVSKGYSIINPYRKHCSSRMIPHEDEQKTVKTHARHLLLRYISSRMKKEGYNSLRYRILSYEKKDLYTNITVDLGKPSRKMEEFRNAYASEELPNCESKMPWEK